MIRFFSNCTTYRTMLNAPFQQVSLDFCFNWVHFHLSQTIGVWSYCTTQRRQRKQHKAKSNSELEIITYFFKQHNRLS